MTKGELRDRYLRYLGEATINGSPKGDQDLRDQFNYLLPGALKIVAAAFPVYKVVAATGSLTPPVDFWMLESITDADGIAIDYRVSPAGDYLFDGAANVKYRVIPQIEPSTADNTKVLVYMPAAELVAIQCAMTAAMGSEAHSYKVSYLSSLYNTMAVQLNISDRARFERVYAM